jgi:hypothetical protein
MSPSLSDAKFGNTPIWKIIYLIKNEAAYFATSCWSSLNPVGGLSYCNEIENYVHFSF